MGIEEFGSNRQILLSFAQTSSILKLHEGLPKAAHNEEDARKLQSNS
jgi:hypothetical protein